jgi:hypothetical protein
MTDEGLRMTARALVLLVEFLPIMGSRKAVNAQDDSREAFFRSLLSRFSEAHRTTTQNLRRRARQVFATIHPAGEVR